MATNLQIKFIRSLQLKKNRDENKLFVCEGTKIVEELLLQKNYKIEEIYAKKEWIASHNGIEFPLIETSEAEMSKISSLSTAPEVLAIVHFATPIRYIQPISLALYLDNLSDPGNLGTIIRTAEWYGITHVFISPQTVQVYNPKVVQATMGSLFRVTIHTLELEEVLKLNIFKNIYGAVLDGVSMNELKFETASLLVMGSESHGIQPRNIPLLTHKLFIPRVGNAESLNVSVATGIILDRITTKLY